MKSGAVWHGEEGDRPACLLPISFILKSRIWGCFLEIELNPYLWGTCVTRILRCQEISLIGKDNFHNPFFVVDKK
jgi:hypothetical protein